MNNDYCNWCDRLTNALVKIYKDNTLIWVGCPSCYEKKKELEKDVTIKKQV